MDKRSNHDLLSDLPLGIIHIILALVPIRDAVKTSILSKQWRYTWATLPDLVFDNECKSDKTSRDRFITQALFLHKGPIRKFKLTVPLMQNCPDIDNWLLFLSRNDIRVLILIDKDIEDCFLLHSSIYDCEHLTYFELRNCVIPSPPLTFNGFLRLQCLSLTDVKLSSSAIERLFANSPLLEKLVLQNVCIYPYQNSKLKIHAPNLKILHVFGTYNEMCTYDPLLAKISSGSLHKNRSPCNFTKLLGGLTNLEEFLGGGYLVQYLSIGVEPFHDYSLLFHRLRVINLDGVVSRYPKQIWVVVSLITGAPNLQKLKISCQETVNGGGFPVFRSEVDSFPSWDSKLAPNFRFERLKLIEMISYYGELNEMELAKFLLASSPVLETLNFKLFSGMPDYPKSLKLAAKLLSYRRASTSAEIVFWSSDGMILFD